MSLVRRLALTALVFAAGPVWSTSSAMAACDGEETQTSRLFLEQITSESAIISWRGDANAVCIGENAANLSLYVDAVEEDGHKRARVKGLEPDTLYHYSVGGAAMAAEGQTFRTAPISGQSPEDGTVHIWILGDSGTHDERDSEGNLSYPGEAHAVRDGFLTYNAEQAGNEPVDVVLFLGDTAYESGTDPEWQGNYFDAYPELLRSTFAVHTIGNHEMGMSIFNICPFFKVPQCEDGPVEMPLGGTSMSSDPMSYDGDGDSKPDGTGPPYLTNFLLPSKGELGGVASGTELYYSVDYGNVHIVSLDSQVSNRDDEKRAAQRDWLIEDLKANELDWTVVIFHHPVYSKGQNHDSDLEDAEIFMRETFASVFEEYGVDVVYNGHAHSYERSWYLHGHYGLSHTFDPAEHAELNPDGTPSLGQSDNPYPQVSVMSQADDKAVYTVAGNAGHVSFAEADNPCPPGELYGCRPADWLQHPAHRSFDILADDYMPNGIFRLGSVVLDATADTLTHRFIDDKGQVLDYFIIRK